VASIGDVVNVAARLEQGDQGISGAVLVSESVSRSLGGITAVEDLGLVELRGSRSPRAFSKSHETWAA
jgi:class 3 adenylate cyclase